MFSEHYIADAGASSKKCISLLAETLQITQLARTAWVMVILDTLDADMNTSTIRHPLWKMQARNIDRTFW